MDISCCLNCYLNHLLKKSYLKETEIKVQGLEIAFRLHISLDPLFWSLENIFWRLDSLI
jgi:hypothetical protein